MHRDIPSYAPSQLCRRAIEECIVWTTGISGPVSYQHTTIAKALSDTLQQQKTVSNNEESQKEVRPVETKITSEFLLLFRLYF